MTMTDKQSRSLDFNSIMVKLIGSLITLVVLGGGWWMTTVWGNQVAQASEISDMKTRLAILETKVDGIDGKVDDVKFGVDTLVKALKKENL